MQITWSEKALFTLTLLGVVSLIFYCTLELGQVARLIPLKVVIPTLALLIVQLLLDVVPQLGQNYKRFERTDLFQVEQFQKKAKLQSLCHSGEEIEEISKRSREWQVFFWILLLLVVIYLFGFFMAIPLYTFLYMKRYSDEGWLLSIGMAAGVGSLIYMLFVLLLGTRLYEGQLWGWSGL